MKNRIIPLVLVPIFALSACSNNQEPAQIATPTDGDKVVYNSDGSISQHPLLEQYSQAQAQGYTGSIDQFAELMHMYETNPQQAQQVAQESGFSGSEMLLGALAGAAVGALAANAASSRSNMAAATYSNQRASNANNYAYSQPYKREEEKKDRRTVTTAPAYVASSSTSQKFATSGTSNTTGTASKPVTYKPLNITNQTKSTVYTPPSRPSSPPPSVSSTRSSSVSTPSRSSSFTSVSRGGFGGAVSSGG